MHRLSRGSAQLLIVDIQTRLLPKIHEAACVCSRCRLMIEASRALDIPITVSEQNVEKLGPTTSEILEASGLALRLEKMTFSACGDEALLRHLCGQGRRQVLLAGIETHVCVQQTALDLLELNFVPVVLADAVGSRRALDREVALNRMRTAGAIVTTVESAVFELTERAGTDLFRRILPLVK